MCAGASGAQQEQCMGRTPWEEKVRVTLTLLSPAACCPLQILSPAEEPSVGFFRIHQTMEMYRPSSQAGRKTYASLPKKPRGAPSAAPVVPSVAQGFIPTLQGSRKGKRAHR